MGSLRKISMGLDSSVKCRNEWQFLENPSIFQVRIERYLKVLFSDLDASNCLEFELSKLKSLKSWYQLELQAAWEVHHHHHHQGFPI